MIRKIHTLYRLGPRRLLRLSKGYRLGWMGAIQGYFTTRTIQALLNIGFFDALHAQIRVDVSSFARANNVDHDILQTLCNSLYALRILDRDGQTYQLTPKGQTLIEVGRGWFNAVYGYGQVYDRLEDLLNKRAVYGKDIQRRAVISARGSCEMESWVHFPVAIDLIRREGWRTVLDLGCGDATFLRHLCRDLKGARGFGIDRDPDVLEDARDATAKSGLSDRIQLALADFTDLDAAPAAFREVDVITTILVLHELLWDGPETVTKALRHIRIQFPAVPIVIVEVIRPTDEAMRRRPGMMVQYLVQHDLSHQRLIDRSRWREIFAAAGYHDVNETYYDFARMAVFTLR